MNVIRAQAAGKGELAIVAGQARGYAGTVRITVMTICALGLVSACSPVASVRPEPQVTAQPGEGQLHPVTRPEGVAVPGAGARKVEEFDTTTAIDRSAALSEAASAGGAVALGVTVASLGSPTEPGFWLKTPLVTAPAKGKVIHAGTGKSVAVELIPIDGPETAGSRMSLSAMRLIEVPLSELLKVEVYRLMDRNI